MRRRILSLLSAVLLVGVGTATAQLVELGSTDASVDFAAGNGDLTYSGVWTGDAAQPGLASYYGPTNVMFAGIEASGGPLNLARSQHHTSPSDRFQMQGNENFQFMLSFEIHNPSIVGRFALNHSTWAASNSDIDLTDTYVILHTDGASASTGWYAALLVHQGPAGQGQFQTQKAVADLSWYEFTPNTVVGTNIVGSLGAAVPAATILGTVVDQAGVYVIEEDITGNNHNWFATYFAAFELEAELVTDPEDLVMSFSDAAAVISNAVDVSYNEGPALTNVNVTSITLENPSHAGFSVSPASLALTSPDPSSEEVWVEFDNNTAGLLVNELATVDLQLVWEEVGSGTSATSTVPVTAQFLGAHAGNILAAFYSESAMNNNNVGTADIAFPGIETQVTGIQWNNNKGGSDDTTYGSLLGNAPVNGGVGQIAAGFGPVTVAFTNDTGNLLEIDSIHFDRGFKWGNGSNEYLTVTISGDLSVGPVVFNNLGDWVGDNLRDYIDTDWDLTAENLELADGGQISVVFEASAGTAMLDNLAFIGRGARVATVGRVGAIDGAGWAVLGVTGLEDGPVSQSVDLIYGEGDLMTNVVITGVSISNLLDSTSNAVSSGMSAVGTFPVELTTPDVTNSAVFDLVFDNTVANLEPGVYTEHIVTIEYTEPGRGPLTSEFYAYGLRPDVTPTNGLIALFDTELLVPDAGYAGVLGGFVSGNFEDAPNLPGKGKGSLDNTYGTLSTSRGDGTNVTWCILMNGQDHLQEASLVITNTTTANIELSELRFDAGRWYVGAGETFSLDVSGDVTAANLLTDEPTTVLGWNNHDFDDHDIDLTGLADRTLAAGESVTFTWTYGYTGSGDIYLAMFIDNIALMGDYDAYGGWADFKGVGGTGENPDGDNMDNLSEFASGNEPLAADGPAGASWLENDGGTDWLYYVHSERQDDPDLSYGDAGSKDALWASSWDTNNVEFVGASSGSGLFITVTNRMEVTGDTKFLGVPLELN